MMDVVAGPCVPGAQRDVLGVSAPIVVWVHQQMLNWLMVPPTRAMWQAMAAVIR
jgi:hypothetical protein